MNQSALPRAGLCLLAVACVAVPQAFALLDLERGALILNTEFGVSYDSNILGRSNGGGDTLFNFAPTLEFRRLGGRGTMTFSAGGNFVFYSSDSDRNHEDYHGSAQITAPVSPDSPLSGAISASYGRSTNVNETVGDLVTTKAFNFGANAAYAFSERLSGTAGASWGNSENENFGNNETFGFNTGLSFQELLFHRLPLTLSYGYLTSKSTDDPTSARKLNTSSQSINVGTNGQLSAKVDGSVSVGFRSTSDQGTAIGSQGDDTGLIASSSLHWAYDELTAVSFNLSKSLDVTADNQSTDTTIVGMTLSRKLSEQLSANLGASHSWSSYRGMSRDDRLLGLNAGLSYMIRRNWTAGLHYNFTSNSSNSPANDFDRHVIGATLTGRF